MDFKEYYGIFRDSDLKIFRDFNGLRDFKRFLGILWILKDLKEFSNTLY